MHDGKLKCQEINCPTSFKTRKNMYCELSEQLYNHWQFAHRFGKFVCKLENCKTCKKAGYVFQSETRQKMYDHLGTAGMSGKVCPGGCGRILAKRDSDAKKHLLFDCYNLKSSIIYCQIYYYLFIISLALSEKKSPLSLLPFVL